MCGEQILGAGADLHLEGSEMTICEIYQLVFKFLNIFMLMSTIFSENTNALKYCEELHVPSKCLTRESSHITCKPRDPVKITFFTYPSKCSRPSCGLIVV